MSEDSFHYSSSGDQLIQAKREPFFFIQYRSPNNSAYFETETYMEQIKNRRDDGTTIPLGIPISEPYSKNGQITRYFMYSGNYNKLDTQKEIERGIDKNQQTENKNPLEPKEKLNPLEPDTNESVLGTDSDLTKRRKGQHYNLTPRSQGFYNNRIEYSLPGHPYDRLNLTPKSKARQQERKQRLQRRQSLE